MNTVLQIAQLFLAAKEIVKVIEEAMPEGGRGREKLEAARQLLNLAGVITEAVAPLVDSVIGIAVGLYNATGTFEKTVGQ
ncbi:MAG: hypothetical protein HYZ18_12780 [Pseudogulbenkiania sp.]|nr:hypothetical protein [Pseudogulbenkiania sp.]